MILSVDAVGMLDVWEHLHIKGRYIFFPFILNAGATFSDIVASTKYPCRFVNISGVYAMVILFEFKVI